MNRLAHPAIVAARADLKETVETYLIQKCGGADDADALKVAHDLFDGYCEQLQLAEAIVEAPEDWISEGFYETEDDVISAGFELAKFCKDVMLVARELWGISAIGMKEAI